MLIDALTLAKKAVQALEDKKGEDIRLVDVRTISGVTDYYLIASGASAPHLKAMFNDVLRTLKEAGVPYFRKAGDPQSGWLVIDYLDVVIHIFSVEARAYYAIESLWTEAPQES